MGRTDFDVFVEGRPAAGSKLSGYVLIDAPKQISGSAVLVRLVGEERTVVQYEEGDWSRKKMVPEAVKPVVKGIQSMMDCCGDENSRYQRHRTKDAAVRIVAVEMPVGSQDMISSKKIEPGKYKLPFQIDLPASLPSSMMVHHNEEGDCSIVYELHAQLKGSGWFSDYKANREVYIQAKPMQEDSQSQPKIPYQAPPETMPIRMLRCYAMGEMTYGCFMENTVLVRGDSTQIAMACYNQSTLKISSVSANLVQITSWEAGGMEANHEKVIGSQTLPNWNELEPLSKEEFQRKKDEPETRNVSAIDAKILAELKDGNHNLILRVPTSANPSYEGQIISIRHVLRVRFVSSYFVDFIAPCPKVEIPVQILASASDQQMLMPEFDIPAWANNVANLVVASSVYVPSQAMQYGGEVAVESGDTPVVAVNDTETPSIPYLFKLMKQTTNHQGLVFQKTHAEAWKTVFATLSADDYGSIIAEVQQEFRKPDIAATLARSCDRFTCAHAAAGAQASLEWLRGAMIGSVFPYIKDLEENKETVLMSQLTDWEKLLLEDALQDAADADPEWQV